MKKSSLAAALAALAILGAPPLLHAFTLGVDLVPVSRDLDNFNDGIDTTTNFSNASPAGEAGGVVSVTVDVDAPDPQFQVLTPAAISPFSVDDFPFFRIQNRGSGGGGGGQVFPLPPNGATVVGIGNGPNFDESQVAFVVPGPNGAGLRIDPIGMGTATTETFDYDYIQLDQYPTISIGEFDRDGGLDGWNPAGNGHLTNTSVSASTSTFAATTAGIDPILQKGGLNVDTAIYDVIEFRIAVDPLSTSRFEFFWGTNTFPGPAGGQSIAITAEIIRDGEFHTYRIDMSDELAWDGTLNLIRVDPLADADAADGRAISIDYVRLISGAGTIDSDGDGLPDNVESETNVFNGPRDTGSDPSVADTDMDGFDDGEEILAGTNPVDDMDFPTGAITGYTESPAIYAIDQAITPNLPILTGSTLVSTSITPALPAGLVIDDENGEISGTPTEVSPATVYTITGEFISGAIDTFDLTLEVSNPRIEGYSASPATYQRNVEIAPNSPTLLGAAPVSYSVSPALPEGLSFDTVSGEISGTPTVFGGPDDFVITAFYSITPDSTFTLSITINASPIVTVDPGNPISVFTPIGEFNNDGDPEGWVVGGGPVPHSVSVSGGLATYATSIGGTDPQFTKTGLGLSTANGAHTLVEIRVRQNQNPPQPIEFFWGDGSGGVSPLNSTLIGAASIPDDLDFHVYQINMEGVFVDPIDVMRFDPGNLESTTFDFDYIRIGSFSLPEPTRITAVSFNFLDEIEITWTSQEGKSYDVEASTDLGDWAPLNTEPIAASPGEDTTTFLDVNAISFTSRYYRVRDLAP